ncbi:Aspergillopepsin-1 [Fulvia fulva]|uniref:Aspergillopepsin-1 n=1 Tax=Passalora fulva TaxID=5499 RepID=A0A9Q8PE54_PASFU|nr:Aspergillopepsin-1 [Fulvia fulva]KAK4618557.1 Aspergillopepsin-1 [Fulvia fulva]UJO20776.1 Aspergillopepsin-1 [Fulvia fulva]WPV32847.1 Aspergillopepsin-1 [Fulvia fulva]
MVLIKQLVATAAMAALALAVPAPKNALAKRSFTAKSHGRGHVGGFDEIARTHRKFGWQILEFNAQPAARFSGTIEPPAPYSTSSSSSSVALPAYAPPVSAGTASSSAVYTTFTISLPTTASDGTGAPTPTPYGTPIYTNTTTVSQSATRTGSEDGEVTTVPEANEAEYLTEVTIGGQKLQMNFDTGSADLWVFSDKLTKEQIGQHAIFVADKSPTFEEIEGATWNISYGDGSSAGGTVGYDTVDVGGVTVEKQAVEIATRMSDMFLRDPNMDGLLGLSFGVLSTVRPKPQHTFWENVLPDLSHPVFTADLEETDGTGTYEFGNIDPDKYSGEIHYVPVNASAGYWQFLMPSYKIGDKVHECSDCSPIIADTGTTLIYLDGPLVEAYYKQVKTVQYDQLHNAWLYDCSETLPDLGIDIGGYMATVKGADMKYAEEVGQCMAGVQQGPGKIQIMGDIVLKQFFAVFDGGEERFGIALKD